VSRIGKQPVDYPAGVEVKVNGQKVEVKGAKGTLSLDAHSHVLVSLDAAARKVNVTRKGDDRLSRSVHGLTRTLIANMIEGVHKGFERRLVVYGLGYKAELDKKRQAQRIAEAWLCQHQVSSSSRRCDCRGG